VFDTGEVFVDVNKISNDIKLNEEGLRDENGEWLFGSMIEKMVKEGCDDVGGEISESEVEEEIKLSMLDDGSGECEDWDKMLNKFKEGVKELGKGGRWFSWGVEYDRNILYVVGE